MAPYVVSTFEELIDILKSPDLSAETIKDNYVFPRSFIDEVLNEEENEIILIDSILDSPKKKVSDLVDISIVPYKVDSIMYLIDHLLRNYYFSLIALEKNYVFLVEEIFKRSSYIDLFDIELPFEKRQRIIDNISKNENVVCCFFKSLCHIYKQSSFPSFACSIVEPIYNKHSDLFLRIASKQKRALWSVLFHFSNKDHLISHFSDFWASHNYSQYSFEINNFIESLNEEQLNKLIPFGMKKTNFSFLNSFLKNPNLSKEGQIKIKKQIVNSFVKKIKEDDYILKIDTDFTEVLPLLPMEKCIVFLRKIKRELFSLSLYSIDSIKIKIDFSQLKNLINTSILLCPDILTDIQSISNFIKYAPLLSFCSNFIENQEKLSTYLSDFLWQKAQNLPEDSFKEVVDTFIKFFIEANNRFLFVEKYIKEFINNPNFPAIIEEFKIYLEEKKGIYPCFVPLN